jgi:hypothetical protein
MPPAISMARVSGVTELAPHEALDRKNRVGRVGHGLALGGLADKAFASFAKATTDGVVRAPSIFSSTTGLPLFITAMQELVVPKSIPRTQSIGSITP